MPKRRDEFDAEAREILDALLERLNAPGLARRLPQPMTEEQELAEWRRAFVDGDEVRAYCNSVPRVDAIALRAAQEAERDNRRRTARKGATANIRNASSAKANRDRVRRRVKALGRDATISRVARELGLDRKTVRKHWPKRE